MVSSVMVCCGDWCWWRLVNAYIRILYFYVVTEQSVPKTENTKDLLPLELEPEMKHGIDWGN